MPIMGYYDGTAVQISEPLQLNQKVIVIPVENQIDMGESAAGGLHKYADPSLVEQEKEAWRKAAIRKHAKNANQDSEKRSFYDNKRTQKANRCR